MVGVEDADGVSFGIGGSVGVEGEERSKGRGECQSDNFSEHIDIV